MSEERKLSKEDFVLQAIRNLRKPPYKGIHAVFSSFNSAFKEYFGEEARETVDRMAKEGKIGRRMVRGGPMLYLPGEIPEGEDTLGKILKGG
jgi:hypothetical protein